MPTKQLQSQKTNQSNLTALQKQQTRRMTVAMHSPTRNNEAFRDTMKTDMMLSEMGTSINPPKNRNEQVMDMLSN